MNHDISLIGAPTDVGAGRQGSRLGPRALRAAGLGAALHGLGLNVRDCGDLTGPATPGLQPVDGYRHLPEVAAWNATVQAAVHTELSQGRLPVLLGGDHSLAIGSISAVARHCRATGKRLRVLWLDAHADCNSRLTTPSGNLHGMPVACLCGLGPKALIDLSGMTPALHPTVMRQIGIRSVDEGEQHLVHDLGLTVFDMQTLHTLGMRDVMRRALADMDADTHLHVSFDVDFLDPSVAPGVGTRVYGGPTLPDAQQCMAMIAATGRLASLDVMELNPDLDPLNATADITVRLVAQMFGLDLTPAPQPPARPAV